MYDDYFGSDRDTYSLVRVKRDWLPEWAWRLACHADRHGLWLTRWLSVPTEEEG